MGMRIDWNRACVAGALPWFGLILSNPTTHFALDLQKIRMRGLPDLELIGGPADGLICIITGPTSGIGQEAAAELARRGAHVVLACRSTPCGEALKIKLEDKARESGQATPRIDVMELDLSSLASVRRFAAGWKQRQLPCDVLINNAGVFFMAGGRSVTSDGFESHIGINHLAHFLLTLELLPSLQLAKRISGRKPRVISVSSRTHLMGTLNRNDPQFTTGYSSLTAYSSSKLFQVCFSRELQRRTEQEVLAVALHPGEVLTDVVRNLPGPMQKLYKFIMPLLLLTPQQGARCTVYCATFPGVEKDVCEKGHCYYDSNCKPVAPLASAENREDAKWLWDWSLEQVALSRNLNIIQ